MVGCPAGILPVTTETAEDQAELLHYPAHDASFRLAKAASIGAQGCPIGVQVKKSSTESPIMFLVIYMHSGYWKTFSRRNGTACHELDRSTGAR